MNFHIANEFWEKKNWHSSRIFITLNLSMNFFTKVYIEFFEVGFREH